MLQSYGFYRGKNTKVANCGIRDKRKERIEDILQVSLFSFLANGVMLTSIALLLYKVSSF